MPFSLSFGMSVLFVLSHQDSYPQLLSTWSSSSFYHIDMADLSPQGVNSLDPWPKSISHPHVDCKKNTVKYGKTEILFMNSPCIHPAPLVAWQSLQDGFCAFCLGRALDKTEQCSRWDLRPFSEQQLKYAALDAWILLALLGHIIKKACWNNLKEECDIVWLLRLLSYFLKFDEFCNLWLHLFQVWTNNHFFKSWHSSFQPTVH